MNLPAAATLSLWAPHFRRGSVSADELMAHCPGLDIATIAAFSRAEGMELVVVAPGDLSDITTPELEPLMEVGSALFLRGLDQLLLPRNWRCIPAQRSLAGPTRAQAEKLLIDAIHNAGETLVGSIFGVEPPAIAPIEFPSEHPARLRQLMTRALTVSALAGRVQQAWTPTMANAEKVSAVARELAHAARRGFEAATNLPLSGPL